MILENTLSEEAKNELNEIKEIEKTVERKNLVYRTNEYTYSLTNFRTTNTFVRYIYNGTIILKEADEDQSSLLFEFTNLKKKIKRQNPEKKQKKKDILKNLYALFDSRERVLDAFESKIFPVKIEGAGFSNLASIAKASDRTRDKVSSHSNPEILTPIQMLQRLPIALAKLKAGSISENLLNQIRQTIYSIYRAK